MASLAFRAERAGDAGRVETALPNPWQWDAFSSVGFQAFLAVLLSISLLALAHVAMPAVARFLVTILTTWAHEAVGHYGIAFAGGGQGLDIDIRPDGSGEATVTTTSPLHALLVNGAGLVLPACLAGVLLYVGLTRKGTSLSLAVLAAGLGMVAYLHIDDDKILLALSAWAAVAGIIAISPASGLVKAITVLFIAFALSLGVLQSVDYAFADMIGDPAERASDTRKIADALGASIDDVGQALILLMVVPYAVSLLFALNWIRRHTRRTH